MAKKPTEKPIVEQKKKTGRPLTYNPEYHVEMGFKLAVAGHNNDEIAKIFSQNTDTFYDWLNKYPEFSDALARGREPATAAVANSLRQRALGFEWFEEVPTKIKRVKLNDAGKKIEEFEEVVITTVKRVVPPDTQACSLYLRNRLSEKWREQVDYNDVSKTPCASIIQRCKEALGEDGKAKK